MATTLQLTPNTNFTLQQGFSQQITISGSSNVSVQATSGDATLVSVTSGLKSVPATFQITAQQGTNNLLVPIVITTNSTDSSLVFYVQVIPSCGVVHLDYCPSLANPAHFEVVYERSVLSRNVDMNATLSDPNGWQLFQAAAPICPVIDNSLASSLVYEQPSKVMGNKLITMRYTVVAPAGMTQCHQSLIAFTMDSTLSCNTPLYLVADCVPPDLRIWQQIGIALAVIFVPWGIALFICIVRRHKRNIGDSIPMSSKRRHKQNKSGSLDVLNRK